MAQAITWKAESITPDIELYRNNRLEYLESNLPKFDLNTLIELENQCYDESNTKEEYEKQLQTLIDELKEVSINKNVEDQQVSIILSPSQPILPVQYVEPVQQFQPIQQLQPSPPITPPVIQSTTIKSYENNQNEIDKYKRDVENHRVRQQIQNNETIAKYLSNSNKNYNYNTDKKHKETSRNSNSSSSANNANSSSSSSKSSHKSTHSESKHSKPKSKEITFVNTLQRILPITKHSSSKPNSNRVLEIFEIQPDKTLCDWRRRG